MKTIDLIGTAVGNTFRSKTRTLLTVLAIFVGAFTLTLTNGLGTGINAYIGKTVNAVGAADVMTVTRTSHTNGVAAANSGPVKYDPNAIARTGPGAPGATVVALTPSDLKKISGIDGVRSVKATKSVSPDFIQGRSGSKYVIGMGSLIAGQRIQLVAGVQPDDSSAEQQVALPTSFVKPLGFGDNKSALGKKVSIAVTDALRTQHIVEATIVGVADQSIASPTGPSATPNAALTDALFTAQNTGVPSNQIQRYAEASIRFSPGASDQQVTALKNRLLKSGYTGTTVADQLGTFKTVIDGIVLVLNAFAVIALLAASFGIVNTLLMSVQERTREIGLMKAMGMGSGRVFSLFSLEAAFIGFLGSALGAGVAIAVGAAVSGALSGSLLANLPGLHLLAFDPASIGVIILVVMAIAFVAGTLPAARAAKADPVASLRYE
ncbi:ABC transporter permease [Rathayibacter sp. KR2-224]|uniref:ABC transporter permease n=1 Tax=Rathayibacter sp. KR2-224 TaxID=3400913 RepID=UPI003C0D614A